MVVLGIIFSHASRVGRIIRLGVELSPSDFFALGFECTICCGGRVVALWRSVRFRKQGIVASNLLSMCVSI